MRRTLLLPGLLILALPALAGGKLDDGTLDPAWFPGVPEFRETESFDYLWVKDGFTVEGRTIRVAPWPSPTFSKKRDAKDGAKAEELTELMPSRLRGALNASLAGKATASKEEGDLVLEGRFVDVNAGSKAAKWIVGFGAGSATATWDMKLVDPESGEVLVAIHHRSISGTHLSDIDDKIAKWLEAFGAAAAKDFGEYAKGKKRKD